MELDPVQAALEILDRGDRRLGRARQRREAGRRLEHRVAVRHPALLLGRGAGQQAPGLGDGQRRAPELADLGALDAAAEREHERLHAVADAEHGDAELEQLGIEPRGAGGVDRGRAAGQDQPLGRAAPHLLGADVVRQQLGEHAALADAAGDQLRVLAPEVEHQHLVVRYRALERQLLDGLVGGDRRPVALRLEISLRQARPLRPSPPCRCAARAGAACPRSAAPGRPSARPG